MAQSSYLTDALRSMSATPQPVAMPSMPSGAGRYASRRTGRTGLTEALRQAGRNVKGVPGRVAGAFGGGQPGPMPAQGGMGMGKTRPGQPPAPAIGGNPDDPRNLPLDRVSMQPSAMTNGNALPAYTLPSWASDSGNDPTGLESKKTFFNAPEQMSPFLKLNQWGVLPGTNLTAEEYAAVGRGETIPAQIASRQQIERMMSGGPLAGTQPLDQPRPMPQGQPVGQMPMPQPQAQPQAPQAPQPPPDYASVYTPQQPDNQIAFRDLMGPKGQGGMFGQAFGQAPQQPAVPQMPPQQMFQVQPPTEMDVANFFQGFGY